MIDVTTATRDQIAAEESAYKEAIKIWSKRAIGEKVDEHCPFCVIAGAKWHSGNGDMIKSPDCKMCPADGIWTNDGIVCSQEYQEWVDAYGTDKLLAATKVLAVIRKAYQRFANQFCGKWYVEGESVYGAYKVLAIDAITYKVRWTSQLRGDVVEWNNGYNRVSPLHWGGQRRIANPKEVREIEGRMKECEEDSESKTTKIVPEEEKAYAVIPLSNSLMNLSDAKDSANKYSLQNKSDYLIVRVLGKQKYIKPDNATTKFEEFSSSTEKKKV